MSQSSLLARPHRRGRGEPGAAIAAQIRNHHISAGFSQYGRDLVVAAHVVRETMQQHHGPPTLNPTALNSHIQHTRTDR